MSIEHERLAIPMDLELNWTKEILIEQNKHLAKLLEENSKLREELREDLREGISLRDYFAGLAMQGLIKPTNDYTIQTRVAWAYNIAESMLKERDKRDV